MSDYGIVVSRFWNRGSGKALRGQPKAQVLALYLMTCGDSTMIGIFPIGLPTISHETGLSICEIESILPVLEQLDIAHYDRAEELMYLPTLARYRLGETLSPGDKKIHAVISQVKSFDGHRFAMAFVERYFEPFRLDRMQNQEAPSKGHRRGIVKPGSPIEGASLEEEEKKKRSEEAPLTPRTVEPVSEASTPPGALPVGDVSAAPQQARDQRAPTRTQATLAKAYADGIRRAAPDVPFPEPSDPRDLRELESMAIASQKSAQTIEAQTWIQRSAETYRRAMADRPQYESGFSPTAWAKWVRGGGVAPKTHSADAPRGQGAPISAPPSPPYHAPFQFAPVVRSPPPQSMIDKFGKKPVSPPTPAPVEGDS